MSMFLRWWLIFCISIAAFFTLYIFGFIDALIAKDTTRLSFGIITIYFIASGFTGWITYNKTKGKKQGANINIGWFITELLLAMGMIGAANAPTEEELPAAVAEEAAEDEDKAEDAE